VRRRFLRRLGQGRILRDDYYGSAQGARASYGIRNRKLRYDTSIASWCIEMVANGPAYLSVSIEPDSAHSITLAGGPLKRAVIRDGNLAPTVRD